MTDYSSGWDQIWAFLLANGISFIDAGCSGGLDQKWVQIMPYIDYFGFDPNEAECERLRSLPHSYRSATYLPYAVSGTGGEQTLYLTNSMYCYSLLRPNHIWLRRFSFSDLFVDTGKTSVRCATLDEIAELHSIRPEILKLDTQGMELPILEAARHSLNDAFCLETETGFVENYEGETTFSQIDEHLRNRGYLLFDITIHSIGRDNPLANAGRHQPLWCETIWLFDFVGQQRLPTMESALKALAICYLLKFLDYGLELAQYFKAHSILPLKEYGWLCDPAQWQPEEAQPHSQVGRLLDFTPAGVREWLTRAIK